MMRTIENLMIEQGIKKASLARDIGKSKSTINGWFNKELEPKTADTVKIAQVLGTTVEELVTGESKFDPAVMYIKKNPALRSLVIKLGLHPELVGTVEGYLSGYMESHGYSEELKGVTSQIILI